MTSSAPSQSWTFAGRTASPQIRPSVSTSRCRLRPATFFSPVVALGAAGLGRLDRLAVEDAGAGGRLPPVQPPDLGPQGGVDLLPDALVPPGVEVVGDGLPGREVVGQHPPGAAAPGQVQDGVDQLPQLVGAGPAGAARPADAAGEEVADVVPLEASQVTGVTLPCDGHADTVNSPPPTGEGHFLDGLLHYP